MTFSLKNGLKMTYYHLKDNQMLIAILLFSLPAVALLQKFSWKSALIYEVCFFLIFIFIRCWDDPKKLGYEN